MSRSHRTSSSVATLPEWVRNPIFGASAGLVGLFFSAFAGYSAGQQTTSSNIARLEATQAAQQLQINTFTTMVSQQGNTGWTAAEQNRHVAEQNDKMENLREDIRELQKLHSRR